MSTHTHTHATPADTAPTDRAQLPLDGIHHISATTGNARANVDFYTRILGLRLVAKSVNQDDPTHYHLFYGDEVAHPGADLTFFEYRGARPGRPGAGMVHSARDTQDILRALAGGGGGGVTINFGGVTLAGATDVDGFARALSMQMAVRTS